jgi:hypothetical protein
MRPAPVRINTKAQKPHLGNLYALWSALLLFGYAVLKLL